VGRRAAHRPLLTRRQVTFAILLYWKITARCPFLRNCFSCPASGSTAFWQPLASRLVHPAERRIVGYPGFGDTPADPDVTDFDGLVRRVLHTIDRPTAVIAQSMGGVIAMHAALERPALVTHLVLTVTSGGLDMRGLGAQDWRTDFARANPHLPDWFLTLHVDLSDAIGRIAQPTLLLWGDDDPISPVAAGQRLLERLPDARLHLVPGGRQRSRGRACRYARAARRCASAAGLRLCGRHARREARRCCDSGRAVGCA
jgi:hypothetical protein